MIIISVLGIASGISNLPPLPLSVICAGKFASAFHKTREKPETPRGRPIFDQAVSLTSSTRACHCILLAEKPKDVRIVTTYKKSRCRQMRCI
jgi:hypothetical protein